LPCDDSSELIIQGTNLTDLIKKCDLGFQDEIKFIVENRMYDEQHTQTALELLKTLLLLAEKDSHNMEDVARMRVLAERVAVNLDSLYMSVKDNDERSKKIFGAIMEIQTSLGVLLENKNRKSFFSL